MSSQKWTWRILHLVSLLAALGCGRQDPTPATGAGAVTPAASNAPSPTQDDPPPFDVGSVIRKVHFAYRLEGSKFVGGHATYGVDVENAQIRFRPEIALTRLQLAELLLEHYPDERAEALDHLDFAIAEFRDMKMQPSLERALRHRG